MIQAQRPNQSLSGRRTRSGLYCLAVACSFLCTSCTQASTSTCSTIYSSRRTPLAFATPRTETNPLQRERESSVRLFSRGPDTQLSAAATLAQVYTGDSSTYDNKYYSASSSSTLDPFDPDFRPWGPSPIAVTADGTTAAAALPVVDYTSSSSATAKNNNIPFKVFCDLDGVLVDFESGVQKICQRSTQELAKTTMWRQIARSKTAFFAELPWMPDGPKLWQAIRHLRPDILTGVPDLKESRRDKVHWCRENLGLRDCRHVDMAGCGYNHANVNGVRKACPESESHVTNIITCWSYNKHHESGEYAVLIDDRIALKESWERKGGIFVHHTDADSTLRKLEELGVLQSSDCDSIRSNHQGGRGRSAFLP